MTAQRQKIGMEAEKRRGTERGGLARAGPVGPLGRSCVAARKSLVVIVGMWFGEVNSPEEVSEREVGHTPEAGEALLEIEQQGAGVCTHKVHKQLTGHLGGVKEGSLRVAA